MRSPVPRPHREGTWCLPEDRRATAAGSWRPLGLLSGTTASSVLDAKHAPSASLHDGDMTEEGAPAAISYSSDARHTRGSGPAKSAVVGLSGAVLNIAVLQALHKPLNVRLIASRAAVELAVANNHRLHGRWPLATLALARRFVRFDVSSLGGLA